MKLLVLGVNHETAPVDIREKVSFSPDEVQDALAELRAEGLANESVILSTCNRTEIYTTLKADTLNACATGYTTTSSSNRKASTTSFTNTPTWMPSNT